MAKCGQQLRSGQPSHINNEAADSECSTYARGVVPMSLLASWYMFASDVCGNFRYIDSKQQQEQESREQIT